MLTPLSYFRLLLLLSFFLVACGPSTSEAPASDADDQETFTIARGVNISHWLSQSERRGEERRAYFTEPDVAFLAARRVDHLRIPIDEEQMRTEGESPF